LRLAGGIHWDNADEPKKPRHIVVARPADFDHDNWDELNAWIVGQLIFSLPLICARLYDLTRI
jgi:hypothetical protein